MNKLILIKILMLFSLMLSIPANAAGYAYDQDIDRIYISSSGGVFFGTTIQPTGTCAYFSEYFKFDSSTDGGKSMLSLLLSVKTAGNKITIWYTESSTPGTNQTNGCTAATMATVTNVGFR